jgi:hypothetical protein
MAPQGRCCHNPAWWAYGRRGEGHIAIPSRRAQRYRCDRCGATFSATRGTAPYRARTEPAAVVRVVMPLARGCPPQALGAACGGDERTVARSPREAEAQRQRVHAPAVQAGQVGLGQLQADELRVRAVGGVLWLATAPGKAAHGRTPRRRRCPATDRSGYHMP